MCVLVMMKVIRGSVMPLPNPQLELQAILSYLMWVLGIELKSLGRSVGFLTTELSFQP